MERTGAEDVRETRARKMKSEFGQLEITQNEERDKQ